MRTLVVIPARYGSTRFPGKPLALLRGKPMIQHVWERCRRAADVDQVIVGTDDERIRAVCEKMGAPCELTAYSHATGTERVAEVARRHGEFEIVINVQCDEPAVMPETITAVGRAIAAGAEISTAVVRLRDGADLEDANVVKVVMSLSGNALYFSRSAIPYVRHAAEDVPFYRHVGLYGFRRETLLRVTELPESPLERTESLEQLRWLEAGWAIRCVEVEQFSRSVDIPEDLKALESSLGTRV